MTRPSYVLAALGFSALVPFVLITRIPDVPSTIGLYVSLYLVAFVTYTVACVFFRSSSERPLLILIVLFAALFRLVLLPVTPTVSTDIYRYVWDGRVASEGINPYRYVPGSPMLRHLRNDTWRRVNYPGTNTPYPPTSQIVFAGAYRLFGENILGLKSVLVLADLAVIALIVRILIAMGLPACAVILYAWHPLPITEFAGAGHQDVLGLALLLGATYLAISGRRWLSATALSASILVKPYALAALPLFSRHSGLRVLFPVVATAWVLYLPYWNIEPRFLFAGSLAYADRWSGNGSLFWALQWIVNLVSSEPERTAKAVASALLTVTILRLALRQSKEPLGLIHSTFAALAAMLLLSPTVYPWYVAWTVPFLCFISIPGWYVFTCTVILGYVMSLHGHPLWLRLIEYVPVYVLLAHATLLSRLQSGVKSAQCADPVTPG